MKNKQLREKNPRRKNKKKVKKEFFFGNYMYH